MSNDQIVERTPDDGLKGERFQYVNPECKCEVDSNDGQTLIMKANLEESHLYVYNSTLPQKGNMGKKQGLYPKIGLIEFNTKSNQISAATTPLEELLSLGEYNNEYPEKLSNYIEKYGFFWPISSYGIVRIDAFELYLFLKPLCRLHKLLEILSNIHEFPSYKMDYEMDYEVDYDDLFELTFFYVFLLPIQIEWEVEEYTYIAESCPHSFGRAWWYPEKMPFSEHSNMAFGKGDDDIVGSSSSWSLPGQSCFISNDFTERAQQRRQVGWKIDFNNGSRIPNIYQEKSSDIQRDILFLYRRFLPKNENDFYIASFLYDLVKNVAKITEINIDGTVKLEKRLTDNPKFDKRYQERLIKIAEIVCKEELDWGIRDIHPIYNIETLHPNWNIPSFVSALYFSLFYINPKYTIFRKCENLNCPCYFEIQRTNITRRFCDRCCNNTAAQRDRRTQKQQYKLFQEKNK